MKQWRPRPIFDAITRLERRICFATPVNSQMDLASYLSAYSGLEVIGYRDAGSAWMCDFRILIDDPMRLFERLLRTLRKDAEIGLADHSRGDYEGATFFRHHPFARHYEVTHGGHGYSGCQTGVTLAEALDCAARLAEYNRQGYPHHHGIYVVRKALMGAE